MKWRQTIQEIAQRPHIQQIIDFVQEGYEDAVSEITDVCEIPAPSHCEGERAEHVARRMAELGAMEALVDEHNNAIGRYPGEDSCARLAVCAHIDTVFPASVDVTVRRKDDRLCAPGVGDNSASVGGMLQLIAAWKDSGYVPPFDVVFVGTAGEEGLGDLKGVREFLDGYAKRPDVDLGAVLSLDGRIGGVVNQGIGSRRLRVTFSAEGGHSWGDFGSPSAVHILGSAVHRISLIDVPEDPRTTYNVGTVEGGTSVNTIAETAAMLIDMRSVGKSELERLEKEVMNIIRDSAEDGGGDFQVEVVGDRPVGSIPEDHPLVEIARAAGQQMGTSMQPRASSTDSNIPLSRGIPAITVGIYRGEDGHRESESMVPSSLRQGIPMACLILEAAAEWILAGGCEPQV